MKAYDFRSAQVDVKNKKGNSPLWLACNGSYLKTLVDLFSFLS